MRTVITNLLVGVLFGSGLTVSQMINPAKVLSFLDFAGNWDPTLGVVMIGALSCAIPGFVIAARRETPLLGKAFQIPSRRDIDAPLIGGAILFGTGWGLLGFCPGPAIAALSSGLWTVFVFVAAMMVGMLLFRLFRVG